ncbi:hypothetical protein [Serratia rubidaea]|uniref:hypothetical protein n=1 Tax=Serratia rubidaea TaxID=61652 RepID=UPI002430D2BD|nr:hypothetical protein [Serratia rubidaea]MCR0997563.1 hypothetical protein [Serratia rubidaea]
MRLTRLKHRFFTLLSTLLFIGCLHSAARAEGHLQTTLQPALSIVSSDMQDIREALTRYAGEDDDAPTPLSRAETRTAERRGSEEEL